MVSLRDGVMKLGDKTYKITGYAVYFVGPLGICTTLDEAISVCDTVNVDVSLNVHPISVAITEEGVYEQV